jgi:DNA-binding NarL/FixJ family response regulator
MKGIRGALRVIIVDDNAEVRSALGSIVYGQPDLELLAVSSGVDEGIEAVRKLQPDVVVLDVNMPGGGGIRAAREMAVVAPGARIIAFSAFDKTLIRKTMMSAGASAYVSKSGDIRELLREIRAGRDPAPEGALTS